MVKIRIADLTVAVENKYSYLERFAKDYLAAPDAEPDMTLSVTDAEIIAEYTEECGRVVPGYLEVLAVYRKIATEILSKDGMLVHGVLMEADGHGILLCARSGVGKSTHSRLWLQTLGDRCHIVNGDKPLFRMDNGVIFGYGTPWCGKEGISENRRVVLDAVAFITRSETNQTEKIESKVQILQRMMTQVFFPENSESRMPVLTLLGQWMEKIPFFEIRCNMNPEAAETAASVILPELAKGEQK